MDDSDTQDATDRFRARIAAKPIAMTPPARRSVAPWVLAALLLVFALGLIANPWFERSVRGQLPAFAQVDSDGPEIAANRTRLDMIEARLRAVESRPAQRIAGPADGGANERVAAVEARLDGLERGGNAQTARIDALTSGVAALTGRVDASAGQTVLTLQAARADADRAQGALAVLAARRAIETGRAAPGLAQPLRALFGQRAGPAVEAVVALTVAPVTIGSLRGGLAQVRGRAPATGGDWWDSLTAGLSDIVTVRSRTTATGDPLSQADAALAGGDLGRAVALVERQPASPAQAGWLASARRLRAGLAGLASLEEGAVAARPALP